MEQEFLLTPQGVGLLGGLTVVGAGTEVGSGAAKQVRDFGGPLLLQFPTPEQQMVELVQGAPSPPARQTSIGLPVGGLVANVGTGVGGLVAKVGTGEGGLVAKVGTGEGGLVAKVGSGVGRGLGGFVEGGSGILSTTTPLLCANFTGLPG